MKKNIYIIGAGDFGREMESWLEQLPDFHLDYQIIGYLDDNQDSLNGKPSAYKIVGTPLGMEFSENDYALLTISNPLTRRNIAENLRHKVKFFTFIAPNATIGKFTKIGEGSIVCSNCFISTNTNIGECVIINAGSIIGHDCKLESYCSLMANVDIGGNVTLSEGVFAGTKSTVIPQKNISSGIIIGAGSVVIRNLAKPGTYFGNPAKLISF